MKFFYRRRAIARPLAMLNIKSPVAYAHWIIIMEEDMAYKITDACTSCGTCAEECPASAINEGKTIYVIDKEACTECGTCVDVCPAEAIVEV